MANTTTKNNGDVVLKNHVPKAEYMYGCMPTSVGMILGYYDINGYNGSDLSNLIDGTVALNSRGTDGDKYDMDAFDTKLGKAIASKGYVSRFYGTTSDEELSYTYTNGDPSKLNTSAWDCIADYLGTGQYWRGNKDKSTTETQNNTLNDLLTKSYSKLTISDGSTSLSIPWRNISMLYGLDLYVKSRGYSLNTKGTASYDVDTYGGSFTFEKYKSEIDAGRPVIISIAGHAMVGYGYNPNTKEIIFDDCYDSDKRMTWGGTYYYSGAERAIQSITTIVFNTSGGGGSGADTTKPTVTNVKASTTAVTNKNVTVTATFSDNVKVQSALYCIDDGAWTAYPSGGVTVTKNSTVSFKAIDSSGNESKVVSCKITNIDKTAPSKPTASASTTAANAKSVTVTAKFSTDTAKKEYSTDGTNWKTYSKGVKFTSNGTIYFRATDAAGNVSGVTTYKITNIGGGSTPAPGPAYDTSACDNNDNDWLYNKKTHVKNKSLYYTTASAPGVEFPVDLSGSLSVGGKHNYVGYKDEADFKIIRLNSAAKLSFTATSTDASKFSVYSLESTGKKDSSGNIIYKQKTLGSVTLKKKKGETEFSGETKEILLAAGDYYVSMESTNAKKGGSAYYNVRLSSDSVFFTKGNKADDDWGVGSIGTLGTLSSTKSALINDWVGFDDEVDYKRFTLSSAAKLCLEIDAMDPVKISVCKLEIKTDKKGKTVCSMKTLQSTTTKTKFSDGVYCAVAKPLLLEKGEYYLRVESTTAKKGANATYSVYLADYPEQNKQTVFFTKGNISDDIAIQNGKMNGATENLGYLDNKKDAWIVKNEWVGYGDPTDYKKFSLAYAADVTFTVYAGDDSKFTVYEIVNKKKKGTTEPALKKLQSKTIKRKDGMATVSLRKLSAGDYFLSMQSTNASKGGNADYLVLVTSTMSSFSSSLAMPESSAEPDAWSASSAVADSAQDGLLAGLTDLGVGNALAAADVSASASLQGENDSLLSLNAGLLA